MNKKNPRILVIMNQNISETTDSTVGKREKDGRVLEDGGGNML